MMHETLKGKVIGQLPEHLRLMHEIRIGLWTMWLRTTSGIPAIPYIYEDSRTVDHMVTDHLWDSRYRVRQWTVWLRATSGIPATAVARSC